FCFSFYFYADHRVLHSFPTRRSSDLINCERFPYLVGGFVQYCYVFSFFGRVRIPDGVPDGVASAASCALRTVIHAFDRVGRVERSEEHTSELQSRGHLVCRLLLEKKK